MLDAALFDGSYLMAMREPLNLHRLTFVYCGGTTAEHCSKREIAPPSSVPSDLLVAMAGRVLSDPWRAGCRSHYQRPNQPTEAYLDSNCCQSMWKALTPSRFHRLATSE